MSKLTKILDSFQELAGYRINYNHEESTELFFALSKLETIRKTKTDDTKVTLFVQNGSFLGESAFTYFASDSKADLIKKINNTINSAKLIKNKPYELYKDGKCVKTLKSNIKDFDPLELGQELFLLAEEAQKETGAKINALEIFINKNEKGVINNLGVDKKVKSFDIFIEAIPTYDLADESFELYQALHTSSFDKKFIKEELVKNLEAVKNRAQAIKPDFKIEAPVVLNKQELCELFNELVDQLHYATIYSHYNLFKLGDNIQENAKGDLLNIKAVNEVKGLVASEIFDIDGVTLGQKELIKDGVLIGEFGSNRFAQYLGKEVTGDIPCFKVETGTFDYKKESKKPYFEGLSFSGIQVDLFSDYIGGEVRLAKYFDGKEVKYITGVSISAKLSDVLKDIRLSNKLSMERNMLGPDKAIMTMEIL